MADGLYSQTQFRKPDNNLGLSTCIPRDKRAEGQFFHSFAHVFIESDYHIHKGSVIYHKSETISKNSVTVCASLKNYLNLKVESLKVKW